MNLEPVPPFVNVAGSEPKLPGRYITKLMRRHKVKIAVLAKRVNYPMAKARGLR